MVHTISKHNLYDVVSNKILHTCIVGNIGCAMEEVANAMSAISLHDLIALGVDMLANQCAKVPTRHTRLNRINCMLQRFVSSSNQLFVGRRHISHQKCFIEVAMKTILEDRYVNIDDISVFKSAHVGNAVANDFIHRGATRLRKIVIV